MNPPFFDQSTPKTVNVHGMTCLVSNEQAPGTPVILMHGLLCSGYFWYPNHLSVFGDRPIYSIALSGHHPSPSLRPEERITPETMAAAFLAQIKALIDDRRCVLVGRSTGARATLPDSEIVLINKSGHLPMFENWPQYQAATTSFMDRLMSSRDAKKALF